MKMKEFGPRGGGVPGAHLDPPTALHTNRNIKELKESLSSFVSQTMYTLH